MSLLEILWPGMLQSEHLHLNGVGEPMMAKPFWEIIDRLKGKKGPFINFNTNGLLMTEENVVRLLQAPIYGISGFLGRSDAGNLSGYSRR